MVYTDSSARFTPRILPRHLTGLALIEIVWKADILFLVFINKVEFIHVTVNFPHANFALYVLIL